MDRKDKQRDRITKYPWYAPSENAYGYKQKVMKKLQYCEDFVYFLRYVAEFGMLFEFRSFDDIRSDIWVEACNCCVQSDGCTEVTAFGYDPDGFSRRKIQILSITLRLIMPMPLVSLISSYYEDRFPYSNVLGFCESHFLDIREIRKYLGKDVRIIMRRSFDKWCVSTATSPESLLK